MRTAFEVTSKRRKGFPSETRVKRGSRIVNGGKELLEKLGRNDPCPCGSGRRFQKVLHAHWRARWFRSAPLLLGTERNTCGPGRVGVTPAGPQFVWPNVNIVLH